jgi:hypothetical protein
MLLIRLEYVPHFPPLYPQIVEIFHFLLGMSHAQVIALLVFQHLLLVLSIAYFAFAQSSRWKRLFVAALVSAGSLLGMSVHGISTEAVALPLLIFMAGACIRIALHGSGSICPLLVYGTSLLLATLARHPFITFGSALPIFYLIQLIWGEGDRTQSGKWFAISSLLVIAIYATSQGVQSAYCIGFGRDCTSIAWRAGVYRMYEAGTLLTPSERTRWIAALQARTADDAVARAIQIMVEHSSPWDGTSKELENDPRIGGGDINKIANDAFRAFLRSPDHVWLQQYMKNLRGYFCRDRPLFDNWIPRYGLMLLRYQQIEETAAQSDDSRDVLIRTGFLRPWKEREGGSKPLARAVLFVDSISPLIVLSLALTLAALRLVISRGKSGAANVAIAIALSIVLYAAAMALVTVVITRYLAPVHLLAWVALSVVVLPTPSGRSSAATCPRSIAQGTRYAFWAKVRSWWTS